MNFKISLDRAGSTTFQHFSEGVYAERIELHGQGSLKVCKLIFYNGDEEDISHYKEVIFSKSDFEGMDVLIPHKKFAVSDYAYCTLKIFAGAVSETDQIYLFCQADRK